MQAYAEAAPFDTAQRCVGAPQQIELAVQITERQLALGCVLHFIESIGTLFGMFRAAVLDSSQMPTMHGQEKHVVNLLASEDFRDRENIPTVATSPAKWSRMPEGGNARHAFTR
jgi:hypothetical protein